MDERTALLCLLYVKLDTVDLTDEDVEYLTECANKILESRAKQ